MSTVNLPPGVPAYKPPTTTPKSPTDIGSNAEDIQNNFLKMLMAQIQNQNPLDPAKPAEFTSQLSQLNTMKGINDLNASVQGFLNQLKSADFMGMSSVVGRNALVPGNLFAFNGGPVVLGAELSGDVTSLRAVVRDAAGQLVDEVSLGPAKAGPLRVQWDGVMSDGRMVSPGAYLVSFEAVAAGGGGVTASTFVPAEVASVGRVGDAVNLRLADGRLVGSNEVREWLK